MSWDESFLENLRVLAWELFIAVVVFVVGFAARTLYDYTRKKRPFHKVWGIKGDDVYVITGNLDLSRTKKQFASVARWPIMASGDIDAFVEVISSLRIIYPKIGIHRYFTGEFPERNISENMVTVGGPVFNLITRRIMSKINSPLHFDKNDNLLDDIIGQTYVPTIEDKKTKKDYGFVMKIPNPFNANNRAIIITGCDTYGVLAGAITLSYVSDVGSAFVKDVQKKMGLIRSRKYFAFTIETNVIGENIGNVKMLNFYHVSYDKSNNRYEFIKRKS